MDEFTQKCLAIIEEIAETRSMKDRDDPIWNLIYTASHLAMGTCQAPHEDWREEIELVYQQFVDEGRL